MISMSIAFFSCSLLIADRAIHKLLVLNILNFDTDLNSSTCAFGTWAISTSLSLFSYCVSVPPCKGQRRRFKSCSWDARKTLPSSQADALFCWHLKLNLSENTLLVFGYQDTNYRVCLKYSQNCQTIMFQHSKTGNYFCESCWESFASAAVAKNHIQQYFAGLQSKIKLNLIVLYCATYWRNKWYFSNPNCILTAHFCGFTGLCQSFLNI